MDFRRKRGALAARSRSVTPDPAHHRVQPPLHVAARRALIMRLADEAPIRPPREDSPLPRSHGFGVRVTPGGSLRLSGAAVPLEQTPGGRVRAKAYGSMPPPFSATEAELVEALDLTDEEAEGVPDVPAQVSRWVHGQEFSEFIPDTPSTAADLDFPSTSGAVSVLKDTSIPFARSKVPLVAADDSLPSTSGATALRRQSVRSVNDGSDLDSEYDDEFDAVHVQRGAVIAKRREIPGDDELDEPVRNIIASVERAMDEEIDVLLDGSSSFTWEEDFETFRGAPEVFSGPTPGPVKDFETPYEAFIEIWGRSLLERIANETNRYAEQVIKVLKDNEALSASSRLHQWTDTNADEILLLFVVYMLMGIDKRSSQNEYWKSEGLLGMANFKELMSYNRFILLNKFLHFVNNADIDSDCPEYAELGLSRKLAKIAPVISHLNEKFASLYNLEKNISIDESLTLFKGRLSWVQAIRSKAARFGIKSYELCESRTGYLYKFQIYTGKSSDTTNEVAPGADLGGKSTKLVLELLQGLEHLGHCVTMDNFYNSPALARYLKSLGYDCLGTLRPNRKNVPSDISKVAKNARKGTIVARHSGDVSVLAWKDTRWVTMISTYHGAETFMGSKAGKPLVKPVSVRDYCSSMAGVDLKDQKLSTYLVERKRCVKWYAKIFKRLLNVSIHNALVLLTKSLQRAGKPVMTHREFRYALSNELWKRHRSESVVLRNPVPTTMRLNREVVHVPFVCHGRKERKRCIVHQKQKASVRVLTKCETCDVFLCFTDCWAKWHSAADLEGREIPLRKRRRL